MYHCWGFSEPSPSNVVSVSITVLGPAKEVEGGVEQKITTVEGYQKLRSDEKEPSKLLDEVVPTDNPSSAVGSDRTRDEL